MRMFYVSLVCLLIVVAIWAIFYYQSIDKVVSNFDEDIKKLCEAAVYENYNEAQTIVTSMLDCWRKTEKLWVYFVHQGDVDEISSILLKIHVFAKTENKLMLLSEVEELKKNLKMLRGNESLSLENLF